ncbi:hypothetical protein [Moorena producens]|uniref:hypothetical protein n=1 Tax=Moorena producens TaxID=1155739 RepID=UPI003C70EFB1
MYGCFNNYKVHIIFSLFPAPCSLLPVPDSLLPAPCSLLPAPCSLLPQKNLYLTELQTALCFINPR